MNKIVVGIVVVIVVLVVVAFFAKTDKFVHDIDLEG